MTRTPSLTPSLTQRIVKQIKLGVPPEVASRLAGVPLDTFASWMTKKGARYRAFVAAVDQAEAVAIADYTSMIRKAAKRGKASAAWRWLTARAPQHFPSARPGIAIGTLNNNTTLIAQIAAVRAEADALVDPRLALEAGQQQALSEPLAEPVVELLDITGEPFPAGERS